MSRPPDLYDPSWTPPPKRPLFAPRPANDPFTRLRPWLTGTFAAALALLALAWTQKGDLVGPERIRPELLTAPLQEPVEQEPFTFTYRGQEVRVRAVASYELAGLVLTHNDITGFGDLYHDATSVDTKDLCVMWGESLRHADYLRARYSSGSFTCYVRWDEPLDHLHLDGIGNHHLITNSDRLRDAIARVRVGDQVRLRGLLVDYQLADWGTFWRRTSTERTDRDCEVVFVEELEILARGTPGWYLLWNVARVLLVLVPLAWLAAFWITSGRDPVRLGEL
jgi:hypothetical protein